VKRKQWIAERLFDNRGFRMMFENDCMLLDQKTPYQRIVIFNNVGFGRILMLDDATQVTSQDEFIYHEMMSHVPLFGHRNPREILIVGGGDCGIAREVLKHSSVEKLTLVEIDKAVVENCRKYFPELSSDVFADSRFQLVIADGRKYVEDKERSFDVIIVDSTDPIGPGAHLFTHEFYQYCKRRLASGGLLVTQSGVPFFQSEQLRSSVLQLDKLFPRTGCYLAPVPSYIGGHLAICWASEDLSLRSVPIEIINERYVAEGCFDTRYWTPAVHHASFALPRFIAETIDPQSRLT
jgi:spermidine synthase